jgi:histidinol-phosphate phosphatase family protein
MKVKKKHRLEDTDISAWRIDKTWSLFLDRDGTINKRLVGEYVKTYHEFIFIEGVLDALPVFNKCFDKILIVTNQQGIGKGIMTEKALRKIHVDMMEEISLNGGFVDEIYYCPFLEQDKPDCRKPNIGMGLQAIQDFPDINFTKSLMIGDAISDMEFGKKLGMKTIFINNDHNKVNGDSVSLIDFQIDSLSEFAEVLVHLLNIEF